MSPRGAALDLPEGGLDLRLPVLAVVAWASALVTLLLPPWVPLTGLALGALLVLWAGRRPVAPGRGRRLGGVTAWGWWVMAVGVVLVALLRLDAVHDNPVAELARERAAVQLTLVTSSDPVLRDGRFGPVVLLRATVEEVTGRGERHQHRAPVLVLAGEEWSGVELGSTVSAAGRLGPARGDDLAGVLHPRGPPVLTQPAGAWWRGAEAVRGGVREAVAERPVAPRTLVPALVAGDDGAMPQQVVDDFQVAGLTHLLAVSGTNLTLVVGALLILARWAGVRARGLLVVGLLGVVGFVLLARTEPSVVRAAAMGTVGLLAMGQHGRRHGTRALAAAVVALLLWDPWWALSVGFALSVLATAGILWLAPGWRDRMCRWLPRWVAEAVSVPLAAQVACTPVVATLSGQVSLVAVAANLLAAPAVGPATVLGLAGGVLALVWSPLGASVARPGSWCAGWIVTVAEHAAALPTAAVPWPAGVVGIAALTVLSAVVALGLAPVLARRRLSLALATALVVVLVAPAPRAPGWLSPGWPPEGWVMVACDVGQGDGLVLRTRAGEAVVVDAGPDPDAIDRCLDRLGVRRVPLVLLTHFHADHVAGLEGVLRGREVAGVETTALREPASGAELVDRVAASAGVPVREAAYAETRELGGLRWQVVSPSVTSVAEGANDASVVLLAESRGVRMLLLGDQEQPAQQRLLRELGDLPVDALKVAHHGSADHEPGLLRATSPELAVISVGAGNDYGHPAPSLLAGLRGVGAEVARTDQVGDLAVVATGAGVELASRR